jgi:hypothetical protein
MIIAEKGLDRQLEEGKKARGKMAKTPLS